MDSLVNITELRYNTLGQRYYMDDPDMGVWTYTYDDNGNLETQTDAKDQTITFTYDELNRVDSKVYSTENLTVSPPIDPPVDYVYDLGTNGIGLLSSVSNRYDPAVNTFVTATYDRYDEVGRVEKVTKTIDAHSYIVETEYDLAGRTKRIIPDTGPGTEYVYHSRSGLIEKVQDDTEYVYAAFTGYQPDGTMGTVSYSNDTTTEYTYGPKSGRMTNITSGPPLPSNPFIDKTYVYSPAGDIKSIDDAVLGITYSYEYDGLHRLLAESDNAGDPPSSASSSSYHYDAASVHGVDAVASSEVGLKSYDYDLNGSMVSVKDGSGTPVKTIAYNADNMPVSIENTEGGNTTTSFSYYAGGEARAKKVVTEGALTETTHYVNSTYEYGVESGLATVYIFAGNLRIAAAKGNVIHYFHKDHLGSTSKTSNELEPGDPDEAPEVVEDAQYLPYGSMRSYWTSGGAVSDYKFTDQELDTSTGLYNYGARLYDSAIGRFLSVDPVVANLYDPQTLDPYAYCRNNPLIYTDPSGEVFLAALGVLFVAPIVIAAVHEIITSPEADTQAPDINDLKKAVLENPIAIAAVAWTARQKARQKERNADGDGKAGTTENGKDAEGASPPAPGMDPNNGDNDSANASKKSAGETRAENIEKGIPEKELGPSGKPKIHVRSHSSPKKAKDAARARAGKGGTIVKHPTPKKGKGHFHGQKQGGRKIRIHDEYPD